MHRRLDRMLEIVAIATLVIPLTTVLADCQSQEASSKERLSRLDPIKGKTLSYTFKDSYDHDQYQYDFSICTDVAPGLEHAGITQKMLGSEHPHLKTIGRINSTSIKTGTDWIMLTYKSGDKYQSHCNGKERQAHIIITCRQDVDAANFAVLYEENQNPLSDCFYLMELESRVACSSKSTGLSSGSVFLIVFMSLLFAYLAFGMLYKRFVLGSKGVDQVPNIGFWRSCGNKQADGCDFLCRCNDSGFDSSRPYRGIADEQLDDDDGDDENLLPM